MVANEMGLIIYETGSLRINNNIQRPMLNLQTARCSDQDKECASYFNLCFDMSSQLLSCNKNDFALSKEFEPRNDQLFNEIPLYGVTFRPDMGTCYLAVSRLNRIDEASQFYLEKMNSK